MEPMRNRKDTIIIEPVHGRHRSDMTFHFIEISDGKYVLHRILHVKKNGMLSVGQSLVKEKCAG